MVEVDGYKRKGKQYQLGLEPGERLVPGMRSEREFPPVVHVDTYYNPFQKKVPYYPSTHASPFEGGHPCSGVGKRAAPYPNSYEEAQESLGTRDQRCVGNHQFLHRDELNSIAIQYHQTDIVTFYPDGSVELNSGGWHTVSTKANINAALPRPSESTRFYIESKKGTWYLVKSRYDEPKDDYTPGWTQLGRWEFYDGMAIGKDGTVYGPGVGG